MREEFTPLYRPKGSAPVPRNISDALVPIKAGTKGIKIIAAVTGVAVTLGVAIGIGVHFATKGGDDTGKDYGTWAPWDSWTSCDVTCGGGEQTRNRTCQNHPVSNLSCVGDDSARQSCSTFTCPNGDVYWASWDAWGACDVTCGSGVYTRYRDCVRTVEGAGQCVGDSREVGMCTETDCPVYGAWSTWSSWGSCNATCGTGQQSRTRTCTKESATDINCVGLESVQQDCNQWDCPNCSRNCDTGVLNDACDTCTCDGNNVTVRTLTTTNKPLMDVYAYAASAPTTLLATSDGGGSLTLTTLCLGAEIILTKEGFLDTNFNLTSSSVNATLQQTENPRLVTSPVSKYRLVGGGAQFCCVAVASPDITYYEWFKDGIILDGALYPVQTELALLNLTTLDSGAYRCRANSPTGAIFSNEVTLLVKETPETFCENAVEDKVSSLPSDCVQSETNTATYNVRTCASTPCRNETTDSEASCSDTAYSCCSPSEYLNVSVQCPGYNISVPVVQSCTCAACTLSLLTVSGVAFGATSNAPLDNGQVYMNGELKTTTSSSGSFAISISASPDAQDLTLKFKDIVNNDFHDMVKVVSIPGTSTDNVYVSVKMVEKPEPVILQSNVENTLYGGSDSSTNSSSAVAEIVIPPDSFYYDNGTKFSGSVSTVLTYILPSDLESYESVPGTFQFVDSDGEVSQLDTMGLFSLQFYDDSNQELSVSEPIDITMPGSSDGVDPDTGASMQLWGLNENTGMWELLPFVSAKRRRRRSSHVVIGQINTGSYYWRNCDIFWRARSCYFNPRVYEDASFSSVVDTSTLRLTYLYTRQSRWGGTSARWRTETYTGPACRRIFCSYSQSYLQLERVSNNKATVLIPRSPHSESSYSIINSGSAVGISMDTSDNNFYSTRTQCLLGSTNSPSNLYFHLPPVEENTSTFNWFQAGIPDSVEPGDYFEYEAKSWCRKLGESPAESQQTKACALKVKVNYATLPDGLKILVSSSMGNASLNFSGDIIGLRRIVPDANGYACVSYRCTTYLDGILDETQVSVYPIVTDDNTVCTVSVQNPNLAFAESQEGESVMNFLVDEDGVESAGLYKYDHGSFSNEEDDCMNLADRVRDTCYRGQKTVVTFTCN